jgi:DNA-binding TFAR19-related protein (PDSD5 family)
LICEALRWKRKHNAERQFDDEQKSQKDAARQMKTILKRVLNEKQTQRLRCVDVTNFQKTFEASRQFIQDWK